MASAMTFNSCGNKVNTGRNGDPSRWPSNSANSENPQNGTSQRGSSSTCFTMQVAELDPAIQSFCEQKAVNHPVLTKIAPYICQKKVLTGLLKKPECGWNGDASKVTSYIYRYDMQTDKTQDFEDIVGYAIHSPTTPEATALPTSLAYQAYDEFKAKGYQWSDGTREILNLNHGNIESGVDYRYRADKSEYEIGFQGHAQLIQLTPDLLAHINYATSDFARILAFEQIVLYQRLPDKTAMTVRIEHRKVASKGLFDIAKKNTMEMSKDTMLKGYSNANKH
jgi:hypothetical protein